MPRFVQPAVCAAITATAAVLVTHQPRKRLLVSRCHGECAVAVAPAVAVGVGICILAAAELAVEAVVVVGSVMVAAAIVAEIEAAEAKRKMCTCLCAKRGFLFGDGSVKVKDLAACHSYCAITYEGTTGVCR